MPQRMPGRMSEYMSEYMSDRMSVGGDHSKKLYVHVPYHKSKRSKAAARNSTMWLMDINGTNGQQIWTQPAKRVSRYSQIVGLRFQNWRPFPSHKPQMASGCRVHADPCPCRQSLKNILWKITILYLAFLIPVSAGLIGQKKS